MSCTLIIIGHDARRPKGPLEAVDLPTQVFLMAPCHACVGGSDVVFDTQTNDFCFRSRGTTPPGSTTEMYVLLFAPLNGLSGFQRVQEWITGPEREWLKAPDKKIYTIDHTLS